MKYFILSIVTLISLSCDDTKFKGYSNNLKIADSLVIKIPDTIKSPNPLDFYSFNDNKLLFSDFTSNPAKLNLFDISNYTWTQIKIDNAEMGLPAEYSFNYENDSLYILDHLRNNIYLKHEKNFSKVNLECFSTNKLFLLQNKSPKRGPNDNFILGITTSEVSFENFKSKLNNYKSLSLINKEDCIYFNDYHDSYFKNAEIVVNDIEPIFTNNEKYIATVYPKSKKLNIYDYNGIKINEVNVSNDMIYGYRTTGDDIKDALLRYYSGLHNEILYDNINKFYYLISTVFFDENELKKFESDFDTDKAIKNKKIIIQTLDSDFNIFDISVFKNIDSNFCFVSNGNLYLRKDELSKEETVKLVKLSF